jgi:hypothetical protein
MEDLQNQVGDLKRANERLVVENNGLRDKNGALTAENAKLKVRVSFSQRVPGTDCAAPTRVHSLPCRTTRTVQRRLRQRCNHIRFSTVRRCT